MSKNISDYLQKTNAVMWFNKLRNIHQLKRKYLQIQVNDNNLQNVMTKKCSYSGWIKSVV